MSVAVLEQCAIDPAASAAPGSLFVATSLHVWSTGEPDRFARDFQINDTVYRRLDPEYYAWLRSRMVLAKKAATAGHLDAAAFEDLRVRFNAVHEWAVEHFGEDELLAAVRTVRAGDYKPPVAEDEGPRVPVPGARKSAADDISPEAMRHGRFDQRAGAIARLEARKAVCHWRRPYFRPGSRPRLLSEARRPDRRSHAPVHRDHPPAAVGGAPPILQPGCGPTVGRRKSTAPIRKTRKSIVPSGY